jgi:hypothetical protein
MQSAVPPGLDDVVGRGDLGRDTGGGFIRAFRPSRFDRELLSVADAAVQRCIPTALVLPIPGTYTGRLTTLGRAEVPVLRQAGRQR